MTGDRSAEDALEIARLAALPALDYEREREASAEKLGCRLTKLDRLVADARGDDSGAENAVRGQGRALHLHEPDPWPEPVDGAALIDALAVAVRRYVVLGEAEATSVALWVLAVHAFDAWRIFPRLLATAPEKGCGKTTLLDVLGPLVPRPLAAANIKAAPLFRVIELARPTLLLDEADAYARDDEDLRSVLDAGHHREGAVIRCVGDGHEPRQFSAWAPVALAAIGHLPATIEDRAIIIHLRRRRPDESVEPLRLDRASGLEELARMAARWVRDHAAALAAAEPAMPAGVVNRTADNWHPLLAVADLAGWAHRARQAASELTAKGDDQGSARVALLADIRDAFAAMHTDRLASEKVVAYLASLDDRPWPEWKNGKPITMTQVARLLKPLHVLSGTIRLPDGHTPKGYYLSAFGDAFARYLPCQQNATTPQPKDPLGSGDIPKRHIGSDDDALWRFETPEKTSIRAACGVVARARGRTPDFHYPRSIRSPPTRNIRVSLPSPSASSRTRKAQYGRSTSSMMT
jgi:Protein of unknown function (DUF3631)